MLKQLKNEEIKFIIKKEESNKADELAINRLLPMQTEVDYSDLGQNQNANV